MYRLVDSPIFCDAGSKGAVCLISIKSAMAILTYCHKATIFSVQTCKRREGFLLELQNTTDSNSIMVNELKLHPWKIQYTKNLAKLNRYLRVTINSKFGTVLYQDTYKIVEQINAYVRRIAQIMIQATDLAQILNRGHPSRKNRGPRKISIWPPFSNMATMGYPEILSFALKGQQMVDKDNYDNKSYVLSIEN